MTAKLWRVNPRSQLYSLGSQFAIEPAATDAWDEVSQDLFFNPTVDGPPNAVGAFSITMGPSTAAFVSLASTPAQVELLTNDNKLRIILAELTYIDQSGSGGSATPVTRTRYLANYPYMDDENSRQYHDCIEGAPRYSRSLDRKTLRGRYSSSTGDLEIDNTDGQFNDLLALACDGSPIAFYMGDAGDIDKGIKPWVRSQFIFMFRATVVKVAARVSGDRRTIALSLKDNGLLLNRTIGANRTVSDAYLDQIGTDITIGPNAPNAGKPLPVPFGFVRQLECVLIDYATSLYAAYDLTPWAASTLEAGEIVTVRDKGLDVPFTNNGDGTFRLLSTPQGTVTADVLIIVNPTGIVGSYTLADTVGSYRVSDAFYAIVALYCGFLSQGIWAGTSPNYDFNNLGDPHVGLAATGNVVDVLDDLCDSANAYCAITRSGKFIYGRIRPDQVDFISSLPSLLTIEDDALRGDENGKISSALDHAEPAYYSVRGYANANWAENQNDFSPISPTFTAAQLEVLKRKGYYSPHSRGDQVDDDGNPTTSAYTGPSFANGIFGALSGYGQTQGGAPQLYHKTMTELSGVKTLISCRSDADADIELQGWNAVRRSTFLPWLEFIDIDVGLSYYYLELGDIVTLNLSLYGISNLRFQIVSIDIALSEHTISLGLTRRRPAVTDIYT